MLLGETYFEHCFAEVKTSCWKKVAKYFPKVAQIETTAVFT